MGSKKEKLENYINNGGDLQYKRPTGFVEDDFLEEQVTDPKYAEVLDIQYVMNVYHGTVPSSNPLSKALFSKGNDIDSDECYSDNTYGCDEDGDNFNRNEDFYVDQSKFIKGMEKEINKKNSEKAQEIKERMEEQARETELKTQQTQKTSGNSE